MNTMHATANHATNLRLDRTWTQEKNLLLLLYEINTKILISPYQISKEIYTYF